METAQDLYRKLHRWPEPSGEESATAALIYDTLSGVGYSPVRIGKTGVYADLVSDPALPWLLLRADTDALRIRECSGLPFASENPGIMHACGHDSHSAMLLEAAGRLIGQALPQNIRFLFQPAEETTLGAAEMLRCGVIPPNLKACFAMHVWPGVPEGTVATRPGALMASSDVYKIQISGRSAHCAQSAKGLDALQTAVTIAARLPDIKAQAADDRTILFCGSIHSGSSHNIVPDQANLWGTLRTFLQADRSKLIGLLEKSCREAAKQYGTEVQILWDGGCPAINNDEKLIDQLRELIPGLFTQQEQTLAAEDFACYQEFAPGVLLWLGAGDVPPLHNEKFYVPERILSIGVDHWIHIATHRW